VRAAARAAGRIETHLDAFWRLRLVQLVIWMIDSREHAAFRDRRREWGRSCLDELAQLGSRA
jgi:hypothetical protein